MKTDFLMFVDHYASSWYPGRKVVLNAIKSRLAVHPSGKIIELDDFGCPWIDHLLDFERSAGKDGCEISDLIPGTILFCISRRKDTSWSIQGVPPLEGDYFETRFVLYMYLFT